MTDQTNLEHSDKKITISVDCMGGDHAPQVPVKAVAAFLKAHPNDNNIYFNLYGNSNIMQTHLYTLQLIKNANVKIIHSGEQITGADKTRNAIKKKQSSMYKTILSVKNHEADIAISGGNTAALFSLSYLLLGCLKGVLRPALSTRIITKNGHVQLLDLGANINSSYKHLVQYALLGMICVRTIYDIPTPTVGLLNIGEEEQKGLENINEAAEELKKLQEIFNFKYVGFVEPNFINKGNIDVLVFDGFVGNILLKTLEGTAQFFINEVTQIIKSNRLQSLLAYPILKKLKQSFKGKLDPRNYNGAFLLGLSNTVIKSHGSADEKSYLSALNLAYKSEKNQMLQTLSNTFSTLDLSE